MSQRSLQADASEALEFKSFLKRPSVRRAGKFLLDGGVAVLGWALANRLVGSGHPITWGLGTWVIFSMAVNLLFRYTSQHFRLLGIEEAESFAFGTLAMVGASVLASAFASRFSFVRESRDLLLVAGVITCPMWLTLRLCFAACYQRLARHRHAQERANPCNGCTIPQLQRTLIVGAGRAGALLCKELRANPQLQCKVVGFVDDALEKQGVRIQGIPVLGHSRLLPTLLKETNATQVILAIPRASGSRLRALTQQIQAEGVSVKTVPGIMNLIGERPWKPEIRDIAIEDLLRREPVYFNSDAIRKEIEGSVVLITGAGGSIGSEIARQVAPFKPSCLVLLGRGENSLWEVEKEFLSGFPHLKLAVELCDIRNPRGLQQVFRAWNPKIVFHAAAHKHVPFLERNPEEAIENNVFGTLNVLHAALDHGTRFFVNVSTDKAVNPTNVLGAAKRITESLVLQAASEAQDGCRFVSVRFGNVLGSRGSVIPLFREQIRKGGPITVTHPDMTRFFMTIPEASQLVLQAGILGATGKVFVLNMGSPVRVLDLAMDMARLSGLTPGIDIDIKFTGMRPGEKLFEELFMDSEQVGLDPDAKMFEAVQAPISPKRLDENLHLLREAIRLPDGLRQREILRCFKRLVPSYQPASTGLGRHDSAESELLMPGFEEVPSVN